MVLSNMYKITVVFKDASLSSSSYQCLLGSNNVHNQSGQVDTRYSTKYAFTAVLGNVWGWLRKRSLLSCYQTGGTGFAWIKYRGNLAGKNKFNFPDWWRGIGVLNERRSMRHLLMQRWPKKYLRVGRMQFYGPNR